MRSSCIADCQPTAQLRHSNPLILFRNRDSRPRRFPRSCIRRPVTPRDRLFLGSLILRIACRMRLRRLCKQDDALAVWPRQANWYYCRQFKRYFGETPCLASFPSRCPALLCALDGLLTPEIWERPGTMQVRTAIRPGSGFRGASDRERAIWTGPRTSMRASGPVLPRQANRTHGSLE